MDQIWKCLDHKRPTEIYCECCKNYLCIECLSNHTACPSPEYTHIFKRAEKVILPRIDRLSESIANETVITKVIESLIKDIMNISPDIKEVIKTHDQAILILKALSAQISSYGIPFKFAHISDHIRNALTSEKKQLKKALKDNDEEQMIKLTKKILSKEEAKNGDDLNKQLIPAIKKALMGLDYINRYKEIIVNLQFLSARCQRLKLSNYITGWACDKKYLSRKMTLSEDRLIYGNSAGDGYPAIIGDTPFDNGICLFSVKPVGLNCTGKEGFGIIEYERYLQIHKSDSLTPVAHQDMVGFFYSNEVKKMEVVAKAQMTMDSEYIVKVDLGKCAMTIKGNGTHLKTDLKPGVKYVPCFSCGCTGNKLIIKVLDSEADTGD